MKVATYFLSSALLAPVVLTACEQQSRGAASKEPAVETDSIRPAAVSNDHEPSVVDRTRTSFDPATGAFAADGLGLKLRVPKGFVVLSTEAQKANLKVDSELADVLVPEAQILAARAIDESRGEQASIAIIVHDLHNLSTEERKEHSAAAFAREAYESAKALPNQIDNMKVAIDGRGVGRLKLGDQEFSMWASTFEFTDIPGSLNIVGNYYLKHSNTILHFQVSGDSRRLVERCRSILESAEFVEK